MGINPGFRWLLVIYDPLVIAPTELMPRITDLAAKAMDSRLTYLPPVFVPFFLKFSPGHWTTPRG
jgi:hypothetical protein